MDGGQSSTTALVGDQGGRVLGSGRGGPCNHVGGPAGREKFVNAIRGSVEAACREAGLEPESLSFEAACLGFSGGPADKRAILGEMLRAATLVVTHDALIALSGATGGAPGIITIAGTGSIAFGRNGAGQTARAGGWGYVFGDEGSGFDLTRQALRAALRSEEGWGPPTSLRDKLLQATGASNANDLLHRFYTTDFPRPRIASFSRLVEEAALAGDVVALEILEGAARQLAAIAGAVRRQLFSAGELVRMAYIGGVFRCRSLRERYTALLEHEAGNRVGPPLYGPAAGALLEAYAAAGLRPALSGLPESEK